MNVHVQSSTNPKMCQVFDKVGLLFITADISLEDFQEKHVKCQRFHNYF